MLHWGEMVVLQGVRAVFFDLYNTLARFWPPREEVQREALRSFGLEASPEGLARGYAQADAFFTRENARRPLRERSPRDLAGFFAEYERLVLAGAGLEVDRDLAGRIWERVRQVKYDLALFPDVLPALRALRARGLVLGVLSNIQREPERLLRDLGLWGEVDFLVTSQEAGAEKPHPPIFRLALERAGVRPPEAVHVGDQYEADVEGARRVGLSPVLMDRYGTYDGPRDCPVVRSMDEVVALLRPRKAPSEKW